MYACLLVNFMMKWKINNNWKNVNSEMQLPKAANNKTINMMSVQCYCLTLTPLKRKIINCNLRSKQDNCVFDLFGFCRFTSLYATTSRSIQKFLKQIDQGPDVGQIFWPRKQTLIRKINNNCPRQYCNPVKFN